VLYKHINTQEAQKRCFCALGKFETVDRNFKTFSWKKAAWGRTLRGFFSRISIYDHLAYMVCTVKAAAA
jgi:hypothetical protein